MGRRRVNKLIDEYNHRDSGLTVGIYLTPDNTFESDQVLGKTFTDSSANGLKTMVSQYLKENYCLVYEPIIQVYLDTGFASYGNDSDIRLRFKRFAYASNEMGELFELPWMYFEEGKTDLARQWRPSGVSGARPADNFDVPGTYGNYTYIQYTDKAWVSLNAMQSKLRHIREHAEEIFEDAGMGGTILLEFDAEYW